MAASSSRSTGANFNPAAASIRAQATSVIFSDGVGSALRAAILGRSSHCRCPSAARRRHSCRPSRSRRHAPSLPSADHRIGARIGAWWRPGLADDRQGQTGAGEDAAVGVTQVVNAHVADFRGLADGPPVGLYLDPMIAAAAGEDVLGILRRNLAQLGEDLARRRRQRDAMLGLLLCRGAPASSRCRPRDRNPPSAPTWPRRGVRRSEATGGWCRQPACPHAAPVPRSAAVARRRPSTARASARGFAACPW